MRRSPRTPGQRAAPLGRVLGSFAPGNGGAAWTPAALAGFVAALLPGRAVLWQDAGKTTRAAADGDPVRVAVCPYSGAEWTAPSDATRPLLYSEGGGLWSLSFDGADDTLAATVPSTSVRTAAFAVSYGPANWVGYPTGLSFTPSTNYALMGGDTGDNGTSNALYSTSGWSGTVLPWIAGVQTRTFRPAATPKVVVFSQTTSIADSTTILHCSIRRSEGGRWWPGRFRSLVVTAAELSAAERALLEAFL